MYTPGQLVGPFRLLGLLGRGGVAEVWKAEHTTLRSVHAIKFLAIHSDTLHGRLLLEGRVQAMLSHPNVVRVTDIVEDRSRIGLVLEFVDGPTLDRWIAGNWAADAVEGIFLGICAGVRAAHARGLVHRDLKPANVLLAKVDGEWIPKVSDFGIARALQSGQGTRTGALLGTLRYMAPEQLRDASRVDARADVWALGCILYELLSRRSLLPDADLVTLYDRLRDGEWPPLATVAPDAPPALVRVVESALTFAVEARPGSVDELLAPWAHASGEARLAAPVEVDPSSSIHRVGDVTLEVRVGGTDDVQAWRGRDADGASVFVKLVPMTGGADSVARVEREARLSASLSCPALLPTRRVSVLPVFGHDALVMVREWSPAPTLEEQARGRRYSLHEVIQRAAAVLDALTYLHEAAPPLAHADLNPGHVLVRPDAVVLIGLGRAGEAGAHSLAASTFVGAFGWQAPEQLTGEAVPASDVYAAGVLAVWMLARCDIGALHDARGRFLYEAAIDAPPAVRSVLARMLAGEPEARPTAAEAATALRAASLAQPRSPPMLSLDESPSGSPTLLPEAAGSTFVDDEAQPGPFPSSRPPAPLAPLPTEPLLRPQASPGVGRRALLGVALAALGLGAVGGFAFARRETEARPTGARAYGEFLLPFGACPQPAPVCPTELALPTPAYTVDFEGPPEGWGGHGFDLSGEAAPVAGPFGQALRITGPADVSGKEGFPSHFESFTVALWARMETSPAFDAVLLFSDGLGLGAYTGFTMAVDWMGQAKATTADGSDAGMILVTSPQRTCRQRWTFFAATYGPSGTALYVDGQLVASSTASAGRLQYGTHPPIFGMDPFYPERGFNGDLDELRVWSTPLEPGQVAAVWNADACRAVDLR